MRLFAAIVAASICAAAAFGQNATLPPIVSLPPADQLALPIPVSDPVLRPAFGAQDQARVAAGPNQFLAVWSDQRYGNADVFASRLDIHGRPLDPAGIPLAPTWAQDVDPDVIWNGSAHVVVWASIGIYGAVVNLDGSATPLGELVPLSQTSSAYKYVALAWNGREYLVEWVDATVLYGETFDPSFRPTSGRFAIADANGVSNPRIATDGGGFMTVWEDATTVHCAAIDTSGRITSRRDLGVPPRSAGAFPAIQFGHGEYVAAWSDGRIRIAGLSPAADLTGHGGVLSEAADFALTPALALMNDGWFATWADVGSLDLVSMRLALDLQPASTATRIAAPESQANPSIASIGSVVVGAWTDARNSGTSSDLFAAELTNSSPEAYLVSLGLPNQDSPEVAVADGIILALWFEQVTDTKQDLLGRRFDASGAPLDAQPFVLRSGSAVAPVAVAASREMFAVAWQDSATSSIRVIRIARDGQRLDAPPVMIPGGEQPALASDGIDFLLAWSQPSGRLSFGMPVREVRAAVFTREGVMRNEGVRISDLPADSSQLDPSKESLVVTWTGAGYLASWSNTLQPVAQSTGIEARFITSGGIPLGASAITVQPLTKYAPPPSSVSSNGSSEIIVGGARGYVLSPSGEVQSSVSLSWPWIAFDGTRYVNGPGPMAPIAPGVLVLTSQRLIKMLPASHDGGVRRVSLHRIGAGPGRRRASR